MWCVIEEILFKLKRNVMIYSIGRRPVQKASEVVRAKKRHMLDYSVSEVPRHDTHIHGI